MASDDRDEPSHRRGLQRRDRPAGEQRDGRRHGREVPGREEVDGRQRRHQEQRDDREQQPGAEQHQGRRSRGHRSTRTRSASARGANRGTPTRPASGGAARRERLHGPLARDREGRASIPQRGELDRQRDDAGRHDHGDRGQTASGHLGLSAPETDDRVHARGPRGRARRGSASTPPRWRAGRTRAPETSGARHRAIARARRWMRWSPRVAIAYGRASDASKATVWVAANARTVNRAASRLIRSEPADRAGPRRRRPRSATGRRRTTSESPAHDRGPPRRSGNRAATDRGR